MISNLRQQLRGGLVRSSIQKPSKWATQYRVMGKPVPGPFSYKYHPWLEEMHDAKSPIVTGQKSAQGGYTETILNVAFYSLDILKEDLLYVLPSTRPDAYDFSSARVKSAAELSPHIASMFSSGSNVGHKRCGAANLYIRGSNAESGLVSIPVAKIFLDEYDRMVQEHIALVWERMSGQFEKQGWFISTPTIPEFGINLRFMESTQEHYYFRCPSCNQFINLELEQNFRLPDPKDLGSAHMVCHKCSTILKHEEKHRFLQGGTWVEHGNEKKATADNRGFRINQLYSSTISPKEFARTFVYAQEDPYHATELYNSKLGLPYVVKGAQITKDDIMRCKMGYRMDDLANVTTKCVTMGVDVGSELHCVILEWDFDLNTLDINTSAKPRVISAQKVRQFEALDDLMRRYQVNYCVVDVAPERRKAKEFADRFVGYVSLCFYGQGQKGKSINVNANNGNEIVEDYQITVDRTSWLDTSMGRFTSQRVILPSDIPEEFEVQVCNLIKQYDKDRSGNSVSKYIAASEKKGDHYAHAFNYAEIALPFAASISENRDIHDFITS